MQLPYTYAIEVVRDINTDIERAMDDDSSEPADSTLLEIRSDGNGYEIWYGGTVIYSTEMNHLEENPDTLREQFAQRLWDGIYDFFANRTPMHELIAKHSTHGKMVHQEQGSNGHQKLSDFQMEILGLVSPALDLLHNHKHVEPGSPAHAKLKQIWNKCD